MVLTNKFQITGISVSSSKKQESFKINYFPFLKIICEKNKNQYKPQKKTARKRKKKEGVGKRKEKEKESKKVTSSVTSR